VAGDLVRDGATGFVYPVGDTAAAARKIQSLAADREQCRRMGRQAQAKVCADYEPGQFADAFLTALQRIHENGSL
jgi:glycosyltransferase involved in cell wall biosynthesis